MANEIQTQAGTIDSPARNEPPRSSLATEQLEEVIGGLQFIFKLVAVKTISWAHDD